MCLVYHGLVGEGDEAGSGGVAWAACCSRGRRDDAGTDGVRCLGYLGADRRTGEGVQPETS